MHELEEFFRLLRLHEIAYDSQRGCYRLVTHYGYSFVFFSKKQMHLWLAQAVDDAMQDCEGFWAARRRLFAEGKLPLPRSGL